MYDRYFEDGEEYTTTEALERAYALGVASVCGDPGAETYETLKRRSPDAYDETIIELAYDEGRAKALRLEADETDGEAIWERLVEVELGAPRDVTEEDPEGGVPDAIRAPKWTALPEGPPERLDLPAFLRR
ncbi:MAG: hypothetical protein ACQET5_15005 [Halobacteriota archaeon]|uniref:hypothetical protein n=1 Tax=Natronomonas sp. TaxID=2184060 RepID=UPI003975E280